MDGCVSVGGVWAGKDVDRKRLAAGFVAGWGLLGGWALLHLFCRSLLLVLLQHMLIIIFFYILNMCVVCEFVGCVLRRWCSREFFS